MRLLIFIIFFACFGCKKTTSNPTIPVDTMYAKDASFIFGTDLSFTNQLLDFNGVFKDNGVVQNPLKIMKSHGHNTVRLRLWYNPLWTKEVYGSAAKKLYSDLADVEKSIVLAKQQQMKVLLDIHYSDIWADPATQEPPAAWKSIKDITELKDSVYQYTIRTLTYLNNKGYMPDMVQIGNETNCGMLFSNVATDFPGGNGCKGQWQNLGDILNSGIKAVREVAAVSNVKTKIILHVADPRNVKWWFDNIISNGKVSDFDILGFSYYPICHTTVPVTQLTTTIASIKSRYKKEVMILETAYPWTEAGNDSYKNQFGSGSAIAGYPATVQGQYDILKDISQAVITGGGKGIIYWEPDWITAPAMKDPWGEGSTWENCTFFDFTGNTIKGIDYPSFNYKW